MVFAKARSWKRREAGESWALPASNPTRAPSLVLFFSSAAEPDLQTPLLKRWNKHEGGHEGSHVESISDKAHLWDKHEPCCSLSTPHHHPPSLMLLVWLEHQTAPPSENSASTFLFRLVVSFFPPFYSRQCCQFARLLFLLMPPAFLICERLQRRVPQTGVCVRV